MNDITFHTFIKVRLCDFGILRSNIRSIFFMSMLHNIIVTVCIFIVIRVYMIFLVKLAMYLKNFYLQFKSKEDI